MSDTPRPQPPQPEPQQPQPPNGTGQPEPAVPAVDTPRGVGGPVRRAWQEGTLTRAQELENLAAWARDKTTEPHAGPLLAAIRLHLAAARQAALPTPRWRPSKARLERAMSNLDAAEALLLDIAPAEYVLDRLPSVLNDVARHLSPTDPRRLQVEHIAEQVGVPGPTRAVDGTGTREPAGGPDRAADRRARVDLAARHRQAIAAASRAAGSGSLREQLRVRSFRNVLLLTAFLLALLAAGLMVLGWRSPSALPLCFAPQQGDQTVVVCPTQSMAIPTGEQSGPGTQDVDDVVGQTVRRNDILVVELVGLTAAAVASAAAIRNLRGSSEPHGLPAALALLKLPLGALTAVLGLLLLRGQFFPGLTALDSSAQILAWALVFGYAQQLFTRLVDQQAHTVLDAVRGGDAARTRPVTAPGDPAR
jgi:hypothetical protein